MSGNLSLINSQIKSEMNNLHCLKRLELHSQNCFDDWWIVECGRIFLALRVRFFEDGVIAKSRRTG